MGAPVAAGAVDEGADDESADVENADVEVASVDGEGVASAALVGGEDRAVASVVGFVGVGAGGAGLQEVKSSAGTSAHPTIRVNCSGS